ncbi:MAG TPA: hypothetical protein VM890_03790 [Longimicrobium sp.]|jgi:hypothetical protein|nr:hypothetical protein [Longimicrobium sp.]
MRPERILALAALWCCAPASASAQAAPSAPVPPPAAAGTGKAISVCVLDHGEIREISATVDPATGDTLVGGRPFAQVHPASSPPYAEGADWFIRGEMVPVGQGSYRMKERYGLARVVGPGDLRHIGEYRGIPMFAEPSASRENPEVVYFMVRPGCLFQPYLAAYEVGAVRG